MKSALPLVCGWILLACSSQAPLGESTSELGEAPPPPASASDAPIDGGTPRPTPPEPKAAPPGAIDYENPRIRPITLADDVTDLAYQTWTHGKIRTDFTPYSSPTVMDAFSISVRHHGGSCTPQSDTCNQSIFAVASNINWDVGRYTGFYPPAPAGAWQFGRLDSGPEIGASAFQLQGKSAGMLINTWSFDHSHSIVGGGPNAVYAITYSKPETPFRNPTSELTLQAFIKLPWATSWKGGIGQLSFFFYLRDRTTSHTFAYVLGIWDSRAPGVGNGVEFVGHDTQVSFVSSPLKPGTLYATLSPYSQAMRNTVTWETPDFFRAHVPARKLLDAIAAIETKTPGLSLSKTPADYELVHAGVLQEVFVGTDPDVNMSMGASVTDFAIYEFY